MDKENYQLHLDETIDVLKQFEIKLQECTLNLMMYGEMSRWNEGAEDGDVINIDGCLLKSSEDDRVKHLLVLQQTVIFVLSKMELELL